MASGLPNTSISALGVNAGIPILPTVNSQNNPKKLRQAAQEFEAVFMQQMIDAMDKTVDRQNSLMGGGSAEEYFRGMLNQEIARNMTQRPGGSGFGLADVIYQQMSKQLPKTEGVTPPNG